MIAGNTVILSGASLCYGRVVAVGGEVLDNVVFPGAGKAVIPFSCLTLLLISLLLIYNY
jgi:TRAP-type C4-dicarboxylate transport system permease small subunit